MPSHPHSRTRITIPIAAASRVGAARDIARRVFRRWGLNLTNPTIDSAIVILSELLSNAHRNSQNLWELADVVLILDTNSVTVEVHDRLPPAPQTPKAGGGLRDQQLGLVHELTAHAGGTTAVSIDPDGRGKTIQVKLALTSLIAGPP